MARPKRKLTHEAPACRKPVRKVELRFLDQLRWNKDHTGFEAVYERASVIAARRKSLEAVQCMAPGAFNWLLAIRAAPSAESNGPQLDDWQRRWLLAAETATAIRSAIVGA